MIKDTISEIPLDSVKTNWWIDFSSWEDFHGIFRSGTKLSLHLVVMKIEDKLRKLKNCSSDIEWIDENGNITINLTENFQELHKEFKITARRKKCRRLEHIAAFNVARYILCEVDTQKLQIPNPLKKVIKINLDFFFCGFTNLMYISDCSYLCSQIKLSDNLFLFYCNWAPLQSRKKDRQKQTTVPPPTLVAKFGNKLIYYNLYMFETQGK